MNTNIIKNKIIKYIKYIEYSFYIILDNNEIYCYG